MKLKNQEIKFLLDFEISNVLNVYAVLKAVLT